MIHAVNPQLTAREASDALAAAIEDIAAFNAVADVAAHYAKSFPSKTASTLRTILDTARILNDVAIPSGLHTAVPTSLWDRFRDLCDVAERKTAAPPENNTAPHHLETPK
jgi:hypothetical protein